MSSAKQTTKKVTVNPVKTAVVAKSTATDVPKEDSALISFGKNVIRLLLLIFICWTAYDIRLHAIKEYGLVIHEFDPWFNMRATQYLADHGWYEFFHWFDYMVW